MTGTIIAIVIVVVLIGIGIYLGIQQTNRDEEAGVIHSFGDWRLTASHLIEGSTNDSPRYPLMGLEASFDMSGDISRDSGRYTLTRFALIGPAALAFKKNRNKKIDDREGYLTVVGPGTGLLKTVSGTNFQDAQKFVLAFNTQVWHAGQQQPPQPS